jgi:hypothetical protein
LAFPDLEKAFDKVNRNKFLDILIADDIPDQIIGAIYNTYNNNKISVKMRPDSSEWRPINEGVRQGCGLSPLLFIIYMGNITK